MSNEAQEPISIRWWGDHKFVITPRVVVRQWGRYIGSDGVAVYCYLASYADVKTGEAFPSQQTIAADLDLSLKTVSEIINDMQALGLLAIDRIRTANGYFLRNEYTLLEPHEPAIPVGQSPRVQRAEARRVKRQKESAVEKAVTRPTSNKSVEPQVTVTHKTSNSLLHPQVTGLQESDSSENETHDDDARTPPPKKSRAKKTPPVAPPEETPTEAQPTLQEYQLTLQRLGVDGVNVTILAEDLFRRRLPITTPGELLAVAQADAAAHGQRIHLPGAWLAAKIITDKLGWDYSTYPAQSWAKHARPARPSTGYGARRPEHPSPPPPLPFPTDDTVAGYLPPEQRRALRAEARRDAQERLNGRTA